LKPISKSTRYPTKSTTPTKSVASIKTKKAGPFGIPTFKAKHKSTKKMYKLTTAAFLHLRFPPAYSAASKRNAKKYRRWGYLRHLGRAAIV